MRRKEGMLEEHKYVSDDGIAGDENPISAIYNKMLAEYEEIRVDDSFKKGFKYAMSFVKNAMTPGEAHAEFITVDVFDGEAYI